MKKSFLLTVAFALFLLSCVSFRKLDFYKVKLGMTKEEVSNALQASPENMIGSKQYADGLMEVQQYHYISGKDIYYWLFFWNGKLVKYETPELRGRNNFDSSKDEMDKVYEGMVRNK